MFYSSKKNQTYISNILTLFEHIILRIKILKKRQIKNDLDLFVNGPNLMRNRIIIHMLAIMAFCFQSLSKRYIFQLTKCEHKGVSKIIDSGDLSFSSVKPQQIFHFF